MNDDEREKQKIKIVVIGGPNVGKTSIIRRFVSKSYDPNNSPTVQLAITTMKYNFNGEEVIMNICDTAGQEQFQSVCPNFYRDAQAALVVFDLTDRKSFGKMQDWVNELNASLAEPIPIVVAGNKVDLEEKRVIKLDEAVDYCNQSELNYYDTSALTDIGIESVFECLLSNVMSQKDINPANDSNVRLEDATSDNKSSGCC